MDCTHCNSIVPESSKFCPECGGQLKTKEEVLIEKLRGLLGSMSATQLLKLISDKEIVLKEIAESLKYRVNDFVNEHQRHHLFQVIIQKVIKEIERREKQDLSSDISDSSISSIIHQLLNSDKLSDEDKKWLTDFEVAFNMDRKAFMKSIFQYLTEFHGVNYKKPRNRKSQFFYDDYENIDYDLRRIVLRKKIRPKEDINGLKTAIEIAETLESLSNPWGIAKTILKAIDK